MCVVKAITRTTIGGIGNTAVLRIRVEQRKQKLIMHHAWLPLCRDQLFQTFFLYCFNDNVNIFIIKY